MNLKSTVLHFFRLVIALFLSFYAIFSFIFALFLALFFILLLALFWTSPELLRDQELKRNGSKPGDVYSFAIILQEVIFRTQPFWACGDPGMVPKGET